jgi:hypothetical protein
MSQRYLLLFWLPLFASWLLMTLEGPFVSAAINRLPNEVVMLAAMGIVTSLSVTIESPIINLLATSTALSKDRPSYQLLRNFTFHWMILLTVITVLLAFTPLFDLIVVQWMNVPDEVAKWVQPGLKIMTFWSAAIAWRRFLQGIMIRFNQTRKVAWGTLVRLVASGGTVVFLAVGTDLPGVIVGSAALMAGVVAEALYATIAAHPILANELTLDSAEDGDDRLTYGQLYRFHLPLAATSFLTLLVQPLVAYSLAQSPNPTLSLAAWPVVFQVTLVARAAAFALPEVVIAKYVDQATFQPIRRFTLTLVGANTLLMVLFVLTPLIGYYLLVVQDLLLPVANLARIGLVLFLPLPALSILISWIRGLMINQGATRVVNFGMFINLIVTIGVLFLGSVNNWPGINAAAIALCAAAGVELLFLLWRVKGVLDYRYPLIRTRLPAIPG